MKPDSRLRETSRSARSRKAWPHPKLARRLRPEPWPRSPSSADRRCHDVVLPGQLTPGSLCRSRSFACSAWWRRRRALVRGPWADGWRAAAKTNFCSTSLSLFRSEMAQNIFGGGHPQAVLSATRAGLLGVRRSGHFTRPCQGSRHAPAASGEPLDQGGRHVTRFYRRPEMCASEQDHLLDGTDGGSPLSLGSDQRA